MTPAGTGGTRFRLFPQYAEGYLEPEPVMLSPVLGSIGPGPRDAVTYVADARDKRAPYDPPAYVPPYEGPTLSPALPDAAGHFDKVPVESAQFLAAHLYGSVRRTLDVWEGYLGGPVTWWHAETNPRLELVPVVHWDNAQSGEGFLETGLWSDPGATPQPFSLNFDVVAHETGHTILFSRLGVPASERLSTPYLAFHESFSDLVGLIAALHFGSVVDRLLEQTGGNLYVLNLISRLGEVSAHRQIRIAANDVKMSHVAGIELRTDGAWFDPLGLGRNAHAVAEPLTGAVFDIVVEIYQDSLVAQGLIPPTSDARGWTPARGRREAADVARVAARSLGRFAPGFRTAVEGARDAVGFCMAHAIRTLDPDTLTFERVGARMLEHSLTLGLARVFPDLLDCYLWRGIDPRPHMGETAPPIAMSQRVGPATLATARQSIKPGCPHCTAGAVSMARRLVPHRHQFTATQGSTFV